MRIVPVVPIAEMVIIAVCSVLLGGIGAATEAWAEEGDTVVVQRVRVVSDLAGNHDYGFTEYHDSEGNVVYSLDTTTDPSLSGQELLFVDEFDAGLQFILENGYPNSLLSYPASTAERNVEGLGATVSFGPEADFYITQLALWRYYDEDNLAYQYKEHTESDLYGIIDYVERFVRTARERGGASVGENSTLDRDMWQKETALACYWGNDGASGSLGYNQDIGAYESQLCTPFVYGKGEGGDEYHVRVVGDRAGISIVDRYGIPRESLPSGEGFRVRVDGDTVGAERSVVLEVSCEVTIPTMAMYRILGKGNYERMIGLRDETVVATFSETLVATSLAGRLGGVVRSVVIVFAVLIGCLYSWNRVKHNTQPQKGE